MRKILIAIVTVLLIILAIQMVTNEIKIGSLEIFGVEEIKSTSSTLDRKIEQGNKAIKTYTSSLGNIDKSYEDLLKSKQQYEEKVKVIATSKKEEAKLLQNYSMEFLWIQIGLHRKQEGVDLNLSLSNTGASTETDLLTGKQVSIYDMNFEVTGTYDAITEFIYDIEEDSKLGFEIEDFSLNPALKDSSQLVAKFTCSDIRIYTESLSGRSPIYNFEEDEDEENNNNSNSNTNTQNDNEDTNDNNTNDNTNTNEDNENSNTAD